MPRIVVVGGGLAKAAAAHEAFEMPGPSRADLLSSLA
jgi:succinate dehydrogenase/fumarate reductase flavoprotein subunit